MARSGLGKGLGALIGPPSAVAGTETTDSGERVHQINLASIVPSALQPRKDFGREALQELIDSIRQHGIIQPLIVRPARAGVAAATGQAGVRFELIAGSVAGARHKPPRDFARRAELYQEALSSPNSAPDNSLIDSLPHEAPA
jgi:hypothetical protein